MNEIQKVSELKVISEIRKRLVDVLQENRSACVVINGRLEITRPVALALLNQLSRDIASIGGNVAIRKEVLSFSPVVVKSICEITLPNGASLCFEALGSAEEDDIRTEEREKRIYHDTLGTAETRSLKRLLEETVGEDFINKILIPLMEHNQQTGRISNRQVAYIKKLARQTGARISEISQQAIGRQINTSEELAQITSAEATAIIEAYKNLL